MHLRRIGLRECRRKSLPSGLLSDELNGGIQGNEKMKIIKALAILVCIGTMCSLTGCGDKNSSSNKDSKSESASMPTTPDGVLMDFFKTAQAGKIDKAYLEANFAGFAKDLDELKKMFGDDQKKIDEAIKEMAEGMTEKLKGAKFTVTNTKVEGDKATVTVKGEKDGEKPDSQDFVVKKVDGKWKIDMK